MPKFNSKGQAILSTNSLLPRSRTMVLLDEFKGYKEQYYTISQTLNEMQNIDIHHMFMEGINIVIKRNKI